MSPLVRKMPAGPTTFPRSAFLAASALFGLAVYASLPAGVVACNDDFGYLKSVVQTLQHGRPWTNDWLEPWAASLSALSAMVYAVTGNFLAATHGLQSALAAVSFLGAAALFHARGLRPSWTIAGAFAVLTFPVALWKALEFTSMILYLPCLLWALWAAERARWTLFFFAWAVAVASRQSAVAWLALPAFELTRTWLRRREPNSSSWRGPAFVLIGALPWLALLFAGMNATHAQIVRTSAVFWRANVGAATITLAVGLAVMGIAGGLGALAVLLGSRDGSRSRPIRYPTLVLGALVAAAVIAFDPRRLLTWDIVTFDGPAGSLYSKLLVVAGIAGWLLVRVRLAPAPVAVALAVLALLALRGDRYDYYFIDVAVAAFFCVRPALVSTEPSPASQSAGHAGALRLAVSLLLVGLLSFHVRFDHGLKLTLDRAWALCSLYEHALRAGKLQPGELRDAPFGYAGWHVHPYSAAHGSDAFRRFASFDRGAASVAWQADEPSLAVPPPDTLADETHRLGWTRQRRFILRRVSPAPPGSSLTDGYRLVPFPLDAAEWTRLIEGPPL